MKMNMETPGSPEDIPHWSTKELIGRKITSAIHSHGCDLLHGPLEQTPDGVLNGCPFPSSPVE